ncbi:MAG TPA: hypothetical protein VFY85_07350, partial [Gemmatimonadaceae bacterium]|nr:hypothetical protein [Gemmatimonadaceae bacterium]
NLRMSAMVLHATGTADGTKLENVSMVNDARAFLESLVGQTIKTSRGRPNVILAVEGPDVIVGTLRSPSAQPVPIEWVQSALDRADST